MQGVNYIGIWHGTYEKQIREPLQTCNMPQTMHLIVYTNRTRMHNNFGGSILCFEFMGTKTTFIFFTNVLPLNCPLQAGPGVKKKLKIKQIVVIIEQSFCDADWCM